MPLRVAAALLSLAHVASGAFYLPGIAPREYMPNERVDMQVNKIDSVKTQLPYEYYSLNFCRPKEGLKEKDENLGEVLSGDQIENSGYELYMKKNKFCNVLCRTEQTTEEMAAFKERIAQNYRVDWILDNLPIAMRIYDDIPEEEGGADQYRYEEGFPIGYVLFDMEEPSAFDQDYEEEEEKEAKVLGHYIFNHVRLKVIVHTEDAYAGHRIVGFEVEPYSVKHEYSGEWSDGADMPQLSTCNDANHVTDMMEPMAVDKEDEIIFTYDVEWIDSPIKWSSRWDLYLKGSPDDQIHWFSILNSTLIVLFLSGMLAMIILRTLHKDIARYNLQYEKGLSEEETQEETGWKLVHAEVFRAPGFSPMLLSVFVGTGAQLFMMTVLVVFFALLGFLSPANRGGLLTALLLLFVFMGSFAGYVSARLYKMFGGQSWRQNTFLTATLFPAVVCTTTFFINLFVWHEKSSLAIPLGTMLAIGLLWFGVSLPLVFLGSFFGYKKAKIEHPVATNKIPRQIPPQMWYMHPIVINSIGGILPFGAVFIEVFFILSAIWLHQVYYLFGFLFLVLVILLITCAEISIVLCYFKLVNEDYHWWWQSIFASGSSAMYLFMYSIVYFVTKLEMTQFTSGLYYFGYMGMISFMFFLFTGCVGFLSCFWFVRTIYASIKVE